MNPNNMNSEETPASKLNNAINSGKNPEEKENYSEAASGETTEYEKPANPEESTEMKNREVSDKSIPSGMSDNSEISGEAELSGTEKYTKIKEEISTPRMPEKTGESEISTTAKKTEISDKQEFTETPNSPEIAENSKQNEITDNKNTTQYTEDNRKTENSEPQDNTHTTDKTLISNSSEEPETADDNNNQAKSDYQTEITEKLTSEDKERINKYKKFKKVDGSTYRRVNQFLRKHTYITAREWAIARLCADFSTRGGAEMTFIGENLPELIPFMTDTYSPQAVNQARSSFKKKVKKSGATFFYGALCGFFTADELDDILFESSEVARFLLEIEGTSVDLDDEIDIEDKITDVMRSVAEASSMIRAPKTVSDEPEDNFEYEDIPEEKIPEECYSDLENLTEEPDIDE